MTDHGPDNFSIDHPAVTIERRDAVLVVTVDDGKANALSAPLIRALSHAVSTAEADPDLGAVVIAGRPNVLSGGFDLNVMRGGTPAERSSLVSDGGALVRQAFGASVPVVAACTGHAVAAGALLLLGCDLRVGADTPTARIGLPEVTISMALPQWAITISQDRLSRRHVHRALAHGRMTDPSGAVDAGFLDQIVPADEVIDTAVSAAAELAAALHSPSYRAIVAASRGSVLAALDAQIAADRAAALDIAG